MRSSFIQSVKATCGQHQSELPEATREASTNSNNKGHQRHKPTARIPEASMRPLECFGISFQRFLYPSKSQSTKLGSALVSITRR